MRLFFAILLLVSTVSAAQPRVDDARQRRTADVRALVEKAGLTYPAAQLYLRAFKAEKELEVWAGAGRGAPLKLLKTYPFCAASGELGPKRKEGDLQVPEGLYVVSQFNPTSNFHLSMKVSYPNASDLVRSDAKRPGGLIYLHGGCASIGCIAIGDEAIEEVYLLGLSAQKAFPFDIFPMRLTDDALAAQQESPHVALWRELKPFFDAFEKTRRPLRPVIGRSGEYRLPTRNPQK